MVPSTSNEVRVGGRFNGDCFGKSVKELAPVPGGSSVESKCELIQVVIQLLPGYTTLMGPEQPPLEQRGGPVHHSGKPHL